MEWISVRDASPDSCAEVWVAFSDAGSDRKHTAIGYYSSTWGVWSFDDEDGRQSYQEYGMTVTHWMPIQFPEPPK